MYASPGDLWLQAKPLLIPVQGCVGQIILLNVEESDVERMLHTFVHWVREPEVFVLDDFAPEHPFSPSDEVLCSIAQNPQAIAQISGILTSGVYIKLMSEPSDDWGRLIELVFWPREFFPNLSDDRDCRMRFDQLVDLAEAMRAENHSIKCALLGEPGDFSAKDLESPHILIW